MDKLQDIIGVRPADNRYNTGGLPHTCQGGHNWCSGQKLIIINPS